MIENFLTGKTYEYKYDVFYYIARYKISIRHADKV